MNLLSTKQFLASGAILIGCWAHTQETQAQEHQKAHIGFVYPLSTNGTQAAQISNTFSLHALAGVSAGEDGVSISGLSTIIKGNQNGAVISGLTNTISGDAKGAQVAGLVNTFGGTSNGIAVAGLVNVSHATKGLQVAGLSNISKEESTAQVTGLYNNAGNSKIQIAGLANNTQKNNGFQIAGLLNKANQTNGQIAGLINIAKKAKGVQIAGLVNIAEESNCPIGIINIITNGEKQIGITYDEAGNAIAAFRSGGKYTYGIVGAGLNTQITHAPYVMEVGFGGRFKISKMLRLNLEISNTCNTDFWDNAYYKSSFRPLIGLNFAKKLELVAGPSFNYVNYMSNQEAYIKKSVYNFFGESSTNSLFFGGMVGLHFKL